MRAFGERLRVWNNHAWNSLADNVCDTLTARTYYIVRAEIGNLTIPYRVTLCGQFQSALVAP